MKKVVFLFMACCAMAMSLMSCHREPELTPEGEKTIAVRKLYYQRVLGQWYYEEQSDTRYRYIAYNFMEKGKLETYEKFLTRKRIKKGDEVIYGDWEIEEDSIIKGKWDLGWKEEYGEMYLSTSEEDGKGHSVVQLHCLEYVNQNELVLKYFGTGNESMLFKRGTSKPSI